MSYHDLKILLELLDAKMVDATPDELEIMKSIRIELCHQKARARIEIETLLDCIFGSKQREVN